MSDFQNPWLTGPTEADDTPAPAVPEARELPRPTAPQPGVPTPDSADRLPRREVGRAATVWWLGAHGGAGESVLSQLVEDSRAADHSWPVMRDGSTSEVVLVARTSASGLAAAQRAATDWASGAIPGVKLLGLVLIADAPGKLPKPLRDLQQVVSGGVPTVWHLAWNEKWRLGEPVALETAPKDARALTAAVTALLNTL